MLLPIGYDNFREIGEEYRQHQGKYPVIFISFKEAKGLDFVSAQANIATLMSQVYSEHKYLLDSLHLDEAQKETFKAILEQRGIHHFITIGIAYRGKLFALAHHRV